MLLDRLPDLCIEAVARRLVEESNESVLARCAAALRMAGTSPAAVSLAERVYEALDPGCVAALAAARERRAADLAWLEGELSSPLPTLPEGLKSAAELREACRAMGASVRGSSSSKAALVEAMERRVATLREGRDRVAAAAAELRAESPGLLRAVSELRCPVSEGVRRVCRSLRRDAQRFITATDAKTRLDASEELLQGLACRTLPNRRYGGTMRLFREAEVLRAVYLAERQRHQRLHRRRRGRGLRTDTDKKEEQDSGGWWDRPGTGLESLREAVCEAVREAERRKVQERQSEERSRETEGWLRQAGVASWAEVDEVADRASERAMGYVNDPRRSGCPGMREQAAALRALLAELGGRRERQRRLAGAVAAFGYREPKDVSFKDLPTRARLYIEEGPEDALGAAAESVREQNFSRRHLIERELVGGRLVMRTMDLNQWFRRRRQAAGGDARSVVEAAHVPEYLRANLRAWVRRETVLEVIDRELAMAADADVVRFAVPTRETMATRLAASVSRVVEYDDRAGVEARVLQVHVRPWVREAARRRQLAMSLSSPPGGAGKGPPPRRELVLTRVHPPGLVLAPDSQS